MKYGKIGKIFGEGVIFARVGGLWGWAGGPGPGPAARQSCSLRPRGQRCNHSNHKDLQLIATVVRYNGSAIPCASPPVGVLRFRRANRS